MEAKGFVKYKYKRFGNQDLKAFVNPLSKRQINLTRVQARVIKTRFGID